MTTVSEHQSIVFWLGKPEAYAHRPRRVDIVETHISVVFLAGDYAYKLKKPVRYDFVDFSTVALREWACREEVRLNLRLAPDVYLGVEPITRDCQGVLMIGGTGAAIDWLVKMRRLPTDQSFDSLHRRGELQREHVERFAELLARFYKRLPPAQISADEYCARYLAHVRSNRRELLAADHHLPLCDVKRIHAFQIQHLLLRTALLDERMRLGRIVDGHGDLRPEHVCFTEQPVVFDCVEFSADLRQVDIADELAFFATECDFLGADWAGQQVAKLVQDQIGDQPSPEVFDFYKSYRACVRAKVAVLRSDQLGGAGSEASSNEALRRLELAGHYAAAWSQPIVLVVGGLSGTGKTTLACAVAEMLGAEQLHTDEIRKEIYGDRAQKAGDSEGVYRAEDRQRVYAELFHRAARLLDDHLCVVMDGTFSSAKTLQEAYDLTAAHGGTFYAVQCICRPELARERIAHRLVKRRDASDAWPGLHELQERRWEPWSEETPHIQVDTEQSLDQQLQQVVSRLSAQAEQADQHDNDISHN